jgi:uncharacterized membrane protein YgcG
VETVLGVSMAPAAVRMVLVEGENADGATVDQDKFELADDNGSAPLSGPEQVIAAIMGTREGAAEAGCEVLSAGVTWSDQGEGAALRDALADRSIENVMLVSAFLAAAALAHAVGNASGYAHTALLFVEPDTATLAVVNTADGSIADVHRLMLPDDDDEAVAALAGMVADAETLDVNPGGVFVVGSGVDVPMIKPALDAATSLSVITPEEPELALARGAALASANAPLFVSSTAALAYALDPGTGEVLDPYALDPRLFDLSESSVGAGVGGQELAYSAVPSPSGAYTMAAGEHGPYREFDEDEFTTGMFPNFAAEPVERAPRQPFLTAMSVMTIFVVGVVALVLSLAVAIRPHVAQRPSLSHSLVAPARQVPPAPQAAVPAPPAPAPTPAPAPAAAPVAPHIPARAPAPAPPPAFVPLPPPVFAPPPPVVVPPLIPRIFAPPPPPLAPWGGGPRGGFGGGHGGFGPGFGGGHGGFGGGRGHR